MTEKSLACNCQKALRHQRVIKESSLPNSPLSISLTLRLTAASFLLRYHVPLEDLSTPAGVSPSPWAAAAVVLCGVCAFLELYCTQPLLPLLAHLFHASKTGVGMTVSASTLGVAISAPIFGAVTERLARKRVIVISLLGVSIPTLLAATSMSLAQLIFWRFLQGIMVPGIIAVVVTYIGEEWPPERVAFIMSLYVSGTALGGFMGRISAGILADIFSWQVSFIALGVASLLGAAAVAAWLPHGTRRVSAQSQSGPLPSFPYQVQEMFRSRRLVATF